MSINGEIIKQFSSNANKNAQRVKLIEILNESMRGVIIANFMTVHLDFVSKNINGKDYSYIRNKKEFDGLVRSLNISFVDFAIQKMIEYSNQNQMDSWRNNSRLIFNFGDKLDNRVSSNYVSNRNNANNKYIDAIKPGNDYLSQSLNKSPTISSPFYNFSVDPFINYDYTVDMPENINKNNNNKYNKLVHNPNTGSRYMDKTDDKMTVHEFQADSIHHKDNLDGLKFKTSHRKFDYKDTGDLDLKDPCCPEEFSFDFM